MRRLTQLITSILYSFRAVLYSGPTGVRILMYHRVEPIENNDGQYDQLNVPPEIFSEQMKILASEYKVVSLADAIDFLKSGVDEIQKKPTVVITFDDGYADNLEHALPILEQYRLPATIFITTAFCDQTLTHERYKDRESPQHLNWDNVKQLAKNPLITIGSHTITHQLLSEIVDKQSRKEIIEKQLETKIKFFCYPKGNYSSRELNTLDHSSYRAAVTVKPGSNSIETSMFELKRTEITARDNSKELHKKLAGAYDLLHRFLDAKRERSFEKSRRRKKAAFR